MPKKEFERLMRINGYVLQRGRGKGSHSIYKNDKGRTLAIGKTYNLMVVKKLIKEYNLTT